MIGKHDRNQKQLFIPGDIEDYIPEDHILKRIDRVLDLSWLYDEVKSLYCLDNERPGIDPESDAGLVDGETVHIDTVERIEESTGKRIENLTADSDYAHSANYQVC